MSQTIWILRDTYEPIEGPYWSGHIRELIKAAKNEQYNLMEACIDDCINPHPTDILLFRPTQDGISRRSFIKKCALLRLFLSTKTLLFMEANRPFSSLPRRSIYRSHRHGLEVNFICTNPPYRMDLS